MRAIDFQLERPVGGLSNSEAGTYPEDGRKQLKSSPGSPDHVLEPQLTCHGVKVTEPPPDRIFFLSSPYGIPH